MSTGLELVPIALAIGIAVAARRKGQVGERDVLTLSTRMRDADLAAAALAGAGACYGVQNGILHGSVNGVAVALTPDVTGIYEAHFELDVDAEMARVGIEQLDHEYTRLVRDHVYERVVTQAAQYGLALESERFEEEDLVLTLRVTEETP
jgi:hypothetical protein